MAEHTAPPQHVEYDFARIEPKWQAVWESQKTFKVGEDTSKPKYYILDMFPYPSGDGLHVGHPEGYTATDIIARHKRMRGFNVLHPMGWDAFGLPAEQYAVKTGTHPRITTETNIGVFRRQLKSLGFSYDWDREVNTTDPEYFRWTQWIFLQLYHKGLAYVADVPVNWCPELGTVLANEEVIDGKSEVGGYDVVRKPMRQWMLKITEYADRLLADLDTVDWPEQIKAQQRNWIGKSIGAEVDFKAVGVNANIRVFTTRPDTLYGATFMVLAPEHPLVDALTTAEQKSAVAEYRDAAARKSELARTDLAKEKTGVFTGGFAINPVTNREIPVWVADYVLMTYGTGAIMCVPGHDTRDWEFATQFSLPIVEVISGGNVETQAHTGDGTLVNSPLINGLAVEPAKEKITAWLEEQGLGVKAINYKLRDWLFSRQRYWGEPFPVIWVDGQPQALPEQMLPIRLPQVESYKPTGTGESPLASIDEWVNTTDPATGKPARRETNTMPQWAGSCWYYLRFIDPHNKTAAWDKDKERYWMPVDLYVGGAEHAVLHLLYARFWHKVLYDLGHVSTAEPFQKLFNQGLILAFTYRTKEGHTVHNKDVELRGEEPFHRETGEALVTAIDKMSKRWGNVVNPDDVVREHGADTLRLYEMFMGPLEQAKPWNPRSVGGVHRFLARAWRLVTEADADGKPTLSRSVGADATPSEATERLLHQTIKKVTDDIDGMRFNTAIAAMMEFVNHLTGLDVVPKSVLESFVLVLSPFAPHLAEEMWQILGHEATLAYEPWPAYDDAKTIENTVTIAVQVLGKTRATIEVPRDAEQSAVLAAAKAHPTIAKQLADVTIKKEIYVPGKIVNFVTGK